MEFELKFLVSGDRGLLIKLGDSISTAINRQVHFLTETIRRKNLPGVEDLVPGYASLLINYDPLNVSPTSLQDEVRACARDLRDKASQPRRCIEVPVCYGGRYGPDLADLATFHRLSEPEVIQLHASVAYLVYFIGFCPGFPYMGEVPKSIATPRLARPRTRVPAGSVGIAGSQTGIYPIETPGGWRLIGMTPLTLFDPTRDPPNLLQAGDEIRFLQISPSEFESVQSAVLTGAYQLKVTEKIPA